MKKLVAVMALSLGTIVSAGHDHQVLCSTHMLPECGGTIVVQSNNINKHAYAVCPKIDKCANTVTLTYVPKDACMNAPLSCDPCAKKSDDRNQCCANTSGEMGGY
jgi:hypothetical protein